MLETETGLRSPDHASINVDAAHDKAWGRASLAFDLKRDFVVVGAKTSQEGTDTYIQMVISHQDLRDLYGELGTLIERMGRSDEP